MNYQYANAPGYLQAAMAQAVQAMMTGGPLPPNCVVMNLTFPQGQGVFSPMIIGQNASHPGAASIYGPPALSPYNPVSQTRAMVPYSLMNPSVPIYNYQNQNQNQNQNQPQRTSAKTKNKIHSNIYNSSSFDTYMRDLSWSRLFDHPTRRSSKSSGQEKNSINNDEKSNGQKKNRSNSATSTTSSATSDETIRRVNVANQGQSSNGTTKPGTKGTLPFKYSSEFLPGLSKTQQQQQQQQQQKSKTNDNATNGKKV